MHRLFQTLHHRSLTISSVAVVFAFLAFGSLWEHRFRMEQEGTRYFIQAGTVAFLGLLVCIVGLINLLKDDRSGYPSMRLSVATLLWALASFPIIGLSLMVVATLLR